MVNLTHAVHDAQITGYRMREYTWNHAPKEMLFEGSADGKTWKTIEHRSTSQFPFVNEKGANTNYLDRMYWVGVPTGPSTYGIPKVQWDEYNANPFAFGAKGSTAAEIRQPSAGTQQTHVCKLGAGADRNMHKGLDTDASGKH